MSNDVNNLAHSFVAMAQAFEQLPVVKADLDLYKARHQEALDIIQRLELRLLDRASELEAAHASTRKAEVERDHAETMFLEIDDKLAKAKDVLKVLIGDAGDFLRVVEPQPEPEPIGEQPLLGEGSHYTEAEYAYPLQEPTPVQGQSEPSPITPSELITGLSSTESAETVEAVSPTDPIALGMSSEDGYSAQLSGAASIENAYPNATTSLEGSVPSDPTPATESSLGSDLRGLTRPVHGNAALLNAGEGPYFGKRYTDVPFYVSLVEWLNGGGTEELYYAH